jgi:hypothetical protein
VGLAAEDGGAGSGVAGDGDETAVARGRGEDAGAAVGGAAVRAGPLCAAPATVLRAPTVPGPDISSAVATAATMSSRAAAEAVRAVRKLVSSSQELMASRSLARSAGRACPAL